MKILAIETSCDETAVSVVEGAGELHQPEFGVLAQVIASQITVHQPFGGVVPNLAKREHQRNLPLVLNEALAQAGLLKGPTLKTLDPKVGPWGAIDAIAVTVGPGLEPALWVGINFAENLARRWQKPLIPINHLEGHIVSPLAQAGAKFAWPILALLISGGHTELILSREWFDYQLLGRTRDDAAGEAFDKVARLLELPYPGGPEIEKLARTNLGGLVASANQFLGPPLPRPMFHDPSLDFSFSGLKTAVRYLLQKHGETRSVFKDTPCLDPTLKAAIAKDFQQAVIDVLLAKTRRAIEEHQPQTLVVAGGVSANRELKRQFENYFRAHEPNIKLLWPELSLSLDNATMIGIAGYLRLVAFGSDNFPATATLAAKGNLAFN